MPSPAIESIEIPANRVPPVATEASGGAKNVAGVMFFLAFIFTVIAFAMPATTAGAQHGQDKVSLAVGMVFWVGLFGFIGFRYARNASRATRAAATATSDPSYTWRLSGKYLIATDGGGAPRPELSVKLSSKLRTMLLAIPRAEVVEHHRAP